jgi:hypothetical protein
MKIENVTGPALQHVRFRDCMSESLASLKFLSNKDLVGEWGSADSRFACRHEVPPCGTKAGHAGVREREKDANRDGKKN